MKFSTALLCVVATVGSALAAGEACATTTYSSSSAFLGATSGVTTVDFQGCSSASGTVSASNCAGMPAGVSFSPPSGGELYIAPAGQSANPTIALGLNFYAGQAITMSLPSLANSFGSDFFQNFGGGSQSGSPASFTISLFNGATLIDTFTTDVASGTGSYFGVIDDNLFDTVTISQAGGFAVMDNTSFGTAAVPEPASWAMMIGGFGMVGAGLRRRRAKVVFA